MIPEGRHRYYRLATEHVAAILEGLALIGHAEAERGLRSKRQNVNSLRFARTCYDHLAGELGVSIMSALQERSLLAPGEGKRFLVSPRGAQWFSEELAIATKSLKPARHGIACACLDWTERRYHWRAPSAQRCCAAALISAIYAEERNTEWYISRSLERSSWRSNLA